MGLIDNIWPIFFLP